MEAPGWLKGGRWRRGWVLVAAGCAGAVLLCTTLLLADMALLLLRVSDPGEGLTLLEGEVEATAGRIRRGGPPGSTNRQGDHGHMHTGPVGSPVGVERPVSEPDPSLFLVMDEKPLPAHIRRETAKVYFSTQVEDILARAGRDLEALKTELPLLVDRRTAGDIDARDTLTVLRKSLAGHVSSLRQLHGALDRHAPSRNESQRRYDVVVGVMSAREHVAHRQALRDTWVGHIKATPELADRVLVKFVVGRRGCNVHPDDRLDKYGCTQGVTGNAVTGQDIRAHFVPLGTIGSHRHNGPIGMDFVVNKWVVVSQLAAFDSGGDGFARDISVSLWGTDSRKRLAKAVFTKARPGTLVGSLRYLDIPPLLLPKGFHASIVAENFSLLDPLDNRVGRHGSTSDGGGLISFLPVSRYGLHQGVFPPIEERVRGERNQYAAGSFTFRTDQHPPASSFWLDWKLGVEYPVVQLAVGDALKIRVHLDTSLYAVRREQFDACRVPPGRAPLEATPAREGAPVLPQTVVFTPRGPGMAYLVSDPIFCRQGVKAVVNITVIRPVEQVDHSPEAKRRRRLEWVEHMSAINRALDQEQAEHGDLLLLHSLVDTYRNLPRKILYFYKWASLLQFNFTLKTDDDCFVNMPRILRGIDGHGLRGKRAVWWGQFRTDWPVERRGKWREPDYTASHYPSFACGAGNVLSHDLVQWLADNSEALKQYQGEDVSLGIWLAALHPVLVRDGTWECFGKCKPGRLAIPEQRPEALRSLWHNQTTCGNPCHCDPPPASPARAQPH